MFNRIVKAAGICCALGIVVVMAAPLSADGVLAPAPLASTIAGQVTDGGGSPAAGIKVDLANASGGIASVYADGNGEFSFSGLSPGRYIVSVCNGADSVRVSLGGPDVYITITASCAG